MSRLNAVFWPGLALAALALATIGVPGRQAPASADALQAAPALSISNCMTVSEGDQFDVDITAEGVGSLLAWEVYFAYNRNLLEVIGRNVSHLLATGGNNRVHDFSDPVPNSTGFYRMAAADLSDSSETKEPTGVLVRLTLRAKAKGVSPSSIYRGDYDGNGSVDFGPTLTATGPSHVGDTDGDGRFDGVIHSGQIAIGTDCVQPAPVIQPDDIGGTNPPGDTQPTDGGSQDGGGTEPLLDTTDGEDPGAGNESANNSEDAGSANNGEETNENTGVAGLSDETGAQPRNNPERPDPPSEGGSGILPLALIIAGLAVAAGGGITYVLIRSTRPL